MKFGKYRADLQPTDMTKCHVYLNRFHATIWINRKNNNLLKTQPLRVTIKCCVFTTEKSDDVDILFRYRVLGCILIKTRT